MLQFKKEIDGFIFVFHNDYFFKEIKVMISNIKQIMKNNCQILFCANINSLENHIFNLSRDIIMYIINQKFDLIEINSKNDYNINFAFTELIYLIIKNKRNEKLLSEFRQSYKEYLSPKEINELNKKEEITNIIDKKEMFTYTISLIGIKNSGKTRMIQKYSEDKNLYQRCIILFTDSFGIRLNINEKDFQKIKKEEKIDGIIYIFDITSKESFKDMKDWIYYLSKNKLLHNYGSVVCANKNDLETERQVSSDEIKSYGISQNMKVFETNSSFGDNINEAFTELITEILAKQDNKKLLFEFLSHYGNLVFKQLNKYIDF